MTKVKCERILLSKWRIGVLPSIVGCYSLSNLAWILVTLEIFGDNWEVSQLPYRMTLLHFWGRKIMSFLAHVNYFEPTPVICLFLVLCHDIENHPWVHALPSRPSSALKFRLSFLWLEAYQISQRQEKKSAINREIWPRVGK